MREHGSLGLALVLLLAGCGAPSPEAEGEVEALEGLEAEAVEGVPPPDEPVAVEPAPPPEPPAARPASPAIGPIDPAGSAPRPAGPIARGPTGSAPHASSPVQPGTEPNLPVAPPPPAPQGEGPLLADLVGDLDQLRAELADCDGVPALVDPLEGAPPSFRRGPAGARASFVRVVGATLGGDRDSLGAEEVVVHVDVGGTRLTLARADLDLPADALATHPIEGQPWAEVDDAVTIAVAVEVDEEDDDRTEPLTRTTRPVPIEPRAFDARSVVDLPLAPIDGRTWTLLGPRPVSISGGSLRLVCARTSTTGSRADAMARVQEVFGALLDAPTPRTGPGCLTLARLLLGRAQAALTPARVTTDVQARRSLGLLAAESRRLAIVLSSAATPELGRAQRALRALRHASGEARAAGASETLVTTCERLAGEALEPLSAERIGRRRREAAVLLAQALPEAAAKGKGVEPLPRALAEVEKALRRTGRAAADQVLVEAAWPALRARIAAACR